MPAAILVGEAHHRQHPLKLRAAFVRASTGLLCQLRGGMIKPDRGTAFQRLGFLDAKVRKATSELSKPQWDQLVSLVLRGPFLGPD